MSCYPACLLIQAILHSDCIFLKDTKRRFYNSNARSKYFRVRTLHLCQCKRAKFVENIHLKDIMSSSIVVKVSGCKQLFQENEIYILVRNCGGLKLQSAIWHSCLESCHTNT